jgi:periplasmic protein TonB
MDILDRDMFDPHPNTPEHTSWTVALLGRLDKALGNSVMDRPIFSVSEAPQPAPVSKSDALLNELARGEFDALFDKAPDKPSELFRQAQNPPPGPSVVLLSSLPYRPTSYTLPKYPPLARLAHVNGQVTFTVDVASDGSASNFKLLSGHALLRLAAQTAVADWKFPAEAAGKEIQAAIEFKMNCPAVQR